MASGLNNTLLVGARSGFAIIGPDGKILFSLTTDDRVTALSLIGNELWVGHTTSLQKYDITTTQASNPKCVVSDIYIHHIHQDADDNIWLSTDDHSLCRIGQLRHLYKTNVVPNVKDAYCISETKHGPLIGGTFGLRLPDGTITLDGIKTWDCLTDQHGKIWSATESGLYCIVNPQFNIPYKHDQSPIYASACRCLAVNKGILYVGTVRGLARNTMQGAEEILTPKGKSLGYVYSLLNMPDGSLMIATLGNGLWHLDKGTLRQIHNGSLSKRDNIYSLATDSSGTLFIAHDNYISRLSPNAPPVTIVQSDDVFAAWNLNFLSCGTLIAGTSNGLIFYNPETGQRLRKLVGPTRNIPWEFSTSRSVLVIENDIILCGTTSGINAIHTKFLTSITKRPTPKCKSVFWKNTKPTIKDGDVHVPTGKWHLGVAVSTHWFADESECLMRVWLKGFDNDWSSFHKISNICYTSLPKGSYQLDAQIYSPLVGLGPEKTLLSFHVD